jgi:hypothetical protein
MLSQTGSAGQSAKKARTGSALFCFDLQHDIQLCAVSHEINEINQKLQIEIFLTF